MSYNIYCPLKSDNFWHAPAGCVAIAGAQILYYLNHKFGVPATAPIVTEMLTRILGRRPIIRQVYGVV